MHHGDCDRDRSSIDAAMPRSSVFQLLYWNLGIFIAQGNMSKWDLTALIRFFTWPRLIWHFPSAQERERRSPPFNHLRMHPFSDGVSALQIYCMKEGVKVRQIDKSFKFQLCSSNTQALSCFVFCNLIFQKIILLFQAWIKLERFHRNSKRSRKWRPKSWMIKHINLSFRNWLHCNFLLWSSLKFSWQMCLSSSHSSA